MENSLVFKLSAFFLEKAQQFNLETVFLYGSYAGGCPKAESDIDLGILFDSAIKDHFKIHSLLTDITYQLTLQLKREVNIVNINPDFDHPMLYYNIIVSGIPLYVKDNDRFLSLKLESLYQMDDFQLFGAKWRKEVAGALLKEVLNA